MTPPQRVRGGVLLVRPQRVVVSVGHGDVAERIDAGLAVVGRHLVGFGHTDPGT